MNPFSKFSQMNKSINDLVNKRINVHPNVHPNKKEKSPFEVMSAWTSFAMSGRKSGVVPRCRMEEGWLPTQVHRNLKKKSSETSDTSFLVNMLVVIKLGHACISLTT